MGVAPPAAGDQPALGRLRNVPEGGRDRFDRELGQGGRPVRVRKGVYAFRPRMEILAVEGFRGGAVEEGIGHELRREGRVRLARGGEPSVLVEAQAPAAQDEGGGEGRKG